MSGDTFEFDDRNHAERFVGTLHDPAATPGDVLTVQADKSIAAAAGGGSTPFLSTVVPLSSAEILALVNTPKLLVPAVAGMVIFPVSIVTAYTRGTRDYTVSANVQIGPAVEPLKWGLGGGFTGAITELDGPGADFAVGFDSALAAWQGAAWDADVTLEQDVVIDGSAAAPATGDGSVIVTTYYMLLPLGPQ